MRRARARSSGASTSSRLLFVQNLTFWLDQAWNSRLAYLFFGSWYGALAAKCSLKKIRVFCIKTGERRVLYLRNYIEVTSFMRHSRPVHSGLFFQPPLWTTTRALCIVTQEFLSSYSPATKPMRWLFSVHFHYTLYNVWWKALSLSLSHFLTC